MTAKMSVKPVTLFGCQLDGMFQVARGRTPVALVKADGRKLKVLSVQDRHGGKAGEFGMKPHEVVREIRAIVGDAGTARAEKAVDRAADVVASRIMMPTASFGAPPAGASRFKVVHPLNPAVPFHFDGSMEEAREAFGTASEITLAKPVWYWRGGSLHGEWHRACPGTRADLIRAGYYAVEGERAPRHTPPAEWFDNFHRRAHREAMIEVG